MQELWNRLETYFAKHAPKVLESLNAPATDDEISRAEAEMELQMPEDVRVSLRIHDGQRELQKDAPAIIPAEYSEAKGTTIATFGELLPLQRVVSATINAKQSMPVQEWLEMFQYSGPVRRDGMWRWLVIVDPGTGDQLALDLNPAPGGNVGQVISISQDPGLAVVASSYRAWFEQLVERYESGRYYIKRLESGLLATLDRLNPKWQ